MEALCLLGTLQHQSGCGAQRGWC